MKRVTSSLFFLQIFGIIVSTLSYFFLSKLIGLSGIKYLEPIRRRLFFICYHWHCLFWLSERFNSKPFKEYQGWPDTGNTRGLASYSN